MTLRYKLFKTPGNIDEVTDLLVSKGARNVEMSLGEISTNLETENIAPVCDYDAQTATGQFDFRYVFLGSYEEASKQLEGQREILKRLGIESILIKP